MTPRSRLISVSPLLHAEFALEPKKSFIYNKTRRIADPNEPKQPNPTAPSTGAMNHAR
jgi:hypothetical protein